jgi:hypothetical protein
MLNDNIKNLYFINHTNGKNKKEENVENTEEVTE